MKYRKSKIFLKENLKNKKIIFFIWPRQTGKTTLLKTIFNELNTNYKLFLNLEILDYHKYFENFSEINNLLIANGFSKNKKFYLFLDEFHKVKNISWILKSLYDEYENLKIIVTWSNNIEINKNIKESFAWRKRIINCFPLDFEEFIIWKEDIKETELKKFLKNPLNENKINLYLEEFIVFWWYPEIVKSNSKQEKIQAFQDIFSFWFNKDILPEIKKDYKFNDFIKQLAYRNSNLLNLNDIAKNIWISQPTAEKFLYLLKESLLVYPVRPFFNNKLKEIVKMPKFYFCDIWFRNFLMNRFEFLDEEKWLLFENFIYSELLKSWIYYDDIKFWRLKTWTNEVDLVLEWEKKAYEVKYKNKIKDSDLKWLKKFEKLYTNFEIEIINKKNMFEILYNSK